MYVRCKRSARGQMPDPARRPVINPATQTVSVSYGTKANRVAVVNAATCNAEDTSGCSQTPVGFHNPVMAFELRLRGRFDAAPSSSPASA